MSPRTHLMLAAAGAVLASVFITAPPAQATPMGFVQELNRAGIVVYDVTSAVTSGYRICDALNTFNGEQVANQVFMHTTWADVPDMDTARVWVVASVEQLCPGHDHRGLVRS